LAFTPAKRNFFIKVSRVLVNPNCRYFKAFSRDSKGILGEDKEKNNKKKYLKKNKNIFEKHLTK